MVAVKRAAVAAVLVFAPGIAAADLGKCDELGRNAVAYKVVMDELVLPADAGALAAKFQEIKTTLAFTLNTQLQEFQSEVVSKKIKPSIELGLVNCANRNPQSGLDFDAERVRTLNDQRVIVELWGNLLATGGNASGAPHAQIGYVIPPMLHYLPEQKTLGRFWVKYPKDGADITTTLRLPEATAFALVGLGVKAFRAKKYDLATWAFVRSEGSIKQAQQYGGSAELETLLTYVRAAASEVRAKALGDSTYNSALTLTEPGL